MTGLGRGTATGPVAVSTAHVPDGEFWARYFPTPAPGDDTVFYDVTRAPAGLELTWWQAEDRAGRDWFWVVWWRGRPQLHGWAATEPGAVAIATTSTTYGPLLHQPGPAARYLASWGE